VRIAVIADVHANLPALEAALGTISALDCHAIYCLGDAIAIGPHPAECLDLLLATPNVHPLMGNHELWFVDGLPTPQPAWMSDGEVAHQRWTHAQIDPALRPVVAQWPVVVEALLGGVRVTFLHYAPAATPAGFAAIVHRPDGETIDRIFARRAADVICYGHTHVAWDVQGRARYVNPGSLGCCQEPLAHFLTLTCSRGACAVERHAVPYDDAPLIAAFAQRQVPERAFLARVFFGSRFRFDGEDAG
jgi:predicted phosphodiesterase